MKRFLNYTLFVFLCGTGFAQDIHYSQFFNSPLNLNPALTGMFPGDYRFAANLRNQWSSVTVPFATFSLSADAQNPFGTRNLGAGILINHDQAGDSRFKTFQINLAGSYIKKLNDDSTLVLSVGVMSGITIRSLSYDVLRFDQQYDGFEYNSSLDHGESFNRDSRVYPNIHFGGAIYKKRDKRQYILGGLSINNLQKPKQTFFQENDIKLDRKLNFFGESAIKLADKWDVIPSINFQFQGKYAEIVPGGSGRYVLTDDKGLFRAVTLGVWYRFQDAIYFTGGMEYDNWKAGISYDINISDLVPASNKRGAFELALIYILDNFNPKRIAHRICPNYL